VHPVGVMPQFWGPADETIQIQIQTTDTRSCSHTPVIVTVLSKIWGFRGLFGSKIRLAISVQNYLATTLPSVNKLANKSVIFHIVAKKSAVKQFFSIRPCYTVVKF